MPLSGSDVHVCVAHRSQFHNHKQGNDFLEELGGALEHSSAKTKKGQKVKGGSSNSRASVTMVTAVGEADVEPASACGDY